MAPLYQIQPSFSGGELDPALWGRVDLAKYQVGARTVKNWIVLPTGGITTRRGTRFVGVTKYPTKPSILLSFQPAEKQEYILEVGEKYIRFYTQGGQLVISPENPTPVEVETPYLIEDLPLLKTVQSADILFICHPNYPPHQLIRYSHTEWVFKPLELKYGPFMDVNITDTTIKPSAVSGTITLTASKAGTFTQDHVGSLFKLPQSVPSSKVWGNPVPPVYSDTTIYRYNNTVAFNGKLYFAIKDNFSGKYPTDTAYWEESCPSTTMEITAYNMYRFSTTGYWAGSVTLKKEDKDSNSWIPVRTFSSSTDRNYEISEAVDGPTRLRLESTNFTQEGGTTPVYNGYVQLESTDTIWEGIAQVTAVSGDGKTCTAKTTRDFANTQEVLAWSQSAWSRGKGYPACAGFYESRFVFGGTYSEPYGIWASKTSDYNNFDRRLKVLEDDSITLRLRAQKRNFIRSMVVLDKILALTSDSEWVIGSEGSDAFTPLSHKVKLQGYRGASIVPPVVIGNRIIYVQSAGATLRDLGYTFESDSYTGNDLCLLAKHLFKHRTITQVAYQQEPTSIIWCIRDDGVLLGLTYVREQEVFAWHRQVTDGKFESVCTIPGSGEDEVWVIVNREVGGINRRYVEQLTFEGPSTDPKDQFCVDSGLTYVGPPTTGPFFLPHLEGKTVSILADGNVIPGLTVTSGKLSLPVPASTVHLGLPYVCDFETLGVEYTTNSGTAQGLQKKISALTIRFQNSRGGKFGPTFDKMDEMKWRSTEFYLEPIKLYSGDKQIDLYSDYSAGGRICIRQEDPLPITILAIMPVIEHGGHTYVTT